MSGTPKPFRALAKPAVFVLCLLPLGIMIGQGVAGDLGANPVEAITHGTGEWGLRLLLITLAVTPLRRLTGWNQLIRYRRMLGLFTYFYAVLHLLTYLWLDQFFVWQDVLQDIVKRPFITVGFLAFVLMTPLALTSTNAMMRRLGRQWARLHRLVYAVAVVAVVHYWWLVKADVREPLVYALILAVLLGFRLCKRRPNTAKRAAQEA